MAYIAVEFNSEKEVKDMEIGRTKWLYKDAIWWPPRKKERLIPSYVTNNADPKKDWVLLKCRPIKYDG
jgi:hypothetical protein